MYIQKIHVTCVSAGVGWERSIAPLLKVMHYGKRGENSHERTQHMYLNHKQLFIYCNPQWYTGDILYLFLSYA